MVIEALLKYVEESKKSGMSDGDIKQALKNYIHTIDHHAVHRGQYRFLPVILAFLRLVLVDRYAISSI